MTQYIFRFAVVLFYSTAFAQTGNRIFVVNGKGRGTRANPGALIAGAFAKTPNDYVLGQLNGTITELPAHTDQDKWLDTLKSCKKEPNAQD